MVIKWFSENIKFKIENNELYVWGLNIEGQLGLGDNLKRTRPTLNSFF